MNASSAAEADHDIGLLGYPGGGLEKSIFATVFMTSFHLLQSQFSKRSTRLGTSEGLKPVNDCCACCLVFDLVTGGDTGSALGLLNTSPT